MSSTREEFEVIVGFDRLSKIGLLITDVDGVMTDGSLFYGADGEALKRFNVRDGLGVRLLQKIGVEVAVVSGRTSAALERRIRDLGIRYFHLSAGDKGAAVRQIIARSGISAERSAFVGDDIIDFLGFDACGCAVAVADAPDYVRQRADIVLTTSGGNGALRELADAVLIAQGHQDLLRLSQTFEPADGGTRQ